MNITVIGAGNGGQAVAASLASRGHLVRVFNRAGHRYNALKQCSEWTCFGAEIAAGKPALLTTDVGEALDAAELIIVTSTADAHAWLASQMAPYLREGQTILLMPGRTGGALEVRKVLRERGVTDRVRVAESQSLVYACRIESPGRVRIIGVKSRVPIAAFPCSDTPYVVDLLRPLYSCIEPARDVLETGFANVGAIFHPAIVLYNASAIERGALFYFYRDTTETIARFLEKLDHERVQLARAYGVDVLGVRDWIKYAYPNSIGNTLHELMRDNPAYHEILAPATLNSRLLSEDIPTGLVPFLAFAEAAGVEMKLTRSVVDILAALLSEDYFAQGRSLTRLGLNGLSPAAILQTIRS